MAGALFAIQSGINQTTNRIDLSPHSTSQLSSMMKTEGLLMRA
jgi:hypothetical protein